MDFALTEEQGALGDVARTILADRATHDRLTALEAEGDTVFDRELWRELAAAGVVGATVPEAYGGAGLGLLALVQVLEEAGRHVAPIPLVPTAVLGATALAGHASDATRHVLLPGVADGSVVLAAGLEERGADDPLVPTTRAEPDGSGWRLSGTKAVVPYAQHADRVVVSAETGEGPALFLVDPGDPAISLTGQSPTNRQPAADVTLDGAPAELLVTGADAVRVLVQRGAAAVCAVQAGVCEAALRMTARHTAEREQFGKPIAEFQAVAQRAADAFIDTEMVRLTAWQALYQLEAGGDATEAVHSAKYWAGEGGMRVVHAAQHLHGGLGVDLDYPLHRYFLWAKANEHTLGTPTRELIRLGGALAEHPV